MWLVMVSSQVVIIVIAPELVEGRNVYNHPYHKTKNL